jgi:hypothetical protein
MKIKKIIIISIIFLLFFLISNAKYKLVSVYKYANYKDQKYDLAAGQLIPLKNSFLIIYPCHGGPVSDTDKPGDRFVFNKNNNILRIF